MDLEKQSVERHPSTPKSTSTSSGSAATARNQVNCAKQNISTKDLLLKVILPFFFLCLTYHGVIVVTPIFLRKSFGSSDSFIGATTSIGGFGELLSSVPIGKALAFFGTRRTLHFALVVILFAYILFAGSLVQEIVLIANCVLGVGFNSYFLAQHTFLTGNVPSNFRGKIFAYVGGTWQVSGIVGGLFMVMFANITGMKLAFVCMCPFLLIILFSQIYFFHDKVNERELEVQFSTEQEEAKDNVDSISESDGEAPAILNKKNALRLRQREILYDFRKEFVALGVYCCLLMFVRYSRILMIPLTGLSLNLSLTEIAVVSSASFFCASCVFPLSGYIMDRCGRKANSILTMIFMAMGFLVMYISIDFYSLLVSGVIIGFGNGLSTGLIMALGGDYAPKDKRRGPFLSLFKLIYGSGQLFGPSMTGIASEYFGVQGGALLALIACVLGVFWAVIYIVDNESEVVQDDSHVVHAKSDSQ